MQSWSLDSFIKEYSVLSVTHIWQVSRQTVFNARASGRGIRIIKIDGNYEVRESKLLRKTPCEDITLVRHNGPVK